MKYLIEILFKKETGEVFMAKVYRYSDFGPRRIGHIFLNSSGGISMCYSPLFGKPFNTDVLAMADCASTILCEPICPNGKRIYEYTAKEISKNNDG